MQTLEMNMKKVIMMSHDEYVIYVIPAHCATLLFSNVDSVTHVIIMGSQRVKKGDEVEKHAQKSKSGNNESECELDVYVYSAHSHFLMHELARRLFFCYISPDSFLAS